MTSIDLNADLGEGCEFDVELMGIVSSCNIACGGHAGDTRSMAATVDLAVANEVAIGAHPAYPDRPGFGRNSHFQCGEELHKSLIKQLDELQEIVRSTGRSVTHVKPHGALYNDAAADQSLARVLVQAVQNVCDNAAIIGPPQSELERAAAEKKYDLHCRSIRRSRLFSGRFFGTAQRAERGSRRHEHDHYSGGYARYEEPADCRERRNFGSTRRHTVHPW